MFLLLLLLHLGEDYPLIFFWYRFDLGHFHVCRNIIWFCLLCDVSPGHVTVTSAASSECLATRVSLKSDVVKSGPRHLKYLDEIFVGEAIHIMIPPLLAQTPTSTHTPLCTKVAAIMLQRAIMKKEALFSSPALHPYHHLLTNLLTSPVYFFYFFLFYLFIINKDDVHCYKCIRASKG